MGTKINRELSAGLAGLAVGAIAFLSNLQPTVAQTTPPFQIPPGGIIEDGSDNALPNPRPSNLPNGNLPETIPNVPTELPETQPSPPPFDRFEPFDVEEGTSESTDAIENAVEEAVPDAATPDTTEAEPEENPDEFPPNPLEIVEPDPLLPEPVVDRPLSPLERLTLKAALDELQRQGEAAYAIRDVQTAFEIWYRELRLRRALGFEEEIPALSRVGEIAWRENNSSGVRVITQRLQAIEQELQAQTPINFTLLLQIAQGYQKMRAYDPAVALYRQILEAARQRQDTATELVALTALGEMQVAWFDFDNAAIAYEDLLKLARSRGDFLQEEQYLKQLEYIYRSNRKPEQALGIQQQLITFYESQQQPLQLAPLKISMGDNYRALNRLDLASSTYQEAFITARTNQQLGYASDALKRLADLYQSINRPNDALVVYQVLADNERLSYNLFGVMEAYEQMGVIFRGMGDAGQAIAAYRQALTLAQQLSYIGKINDYTAQIQAIIQPPAPTAPSAP